MNIIDSYTNKFSSINGAVFAYLINYIDLEVAGITSGVN